MMIDFVFPILAGLMLISAGLVAFRPKPIESALWLVLNLILTSALYVLLGAHFVAVIQVLVYAGAILVLFTFVILLLNLDPKELGVDASIPWSSLVLIVGALSTVLLCLHVATPELLKKMPPASSADYGTVEAFSRVLIEKYVWTFEVAGLLLLLAIIGVGMLSYRQAKSAQLPDPKKAKEAA